MAIRIDVACNDPDNGNFIGKFHMLQVTAGDDDMEFEGPLYQSDGITFSVKDGRARFGRIRVPILQSKDWVGNWCWNSVWVRWPDALKVINYLGKQTVQGWHMSCGPELLYDAFNARREITPAEWKRNNET